MHGHNAYKDPMYQEAVDAFDLFNVTSSESANVKYIGCNELYLLQWDFLSYTLEFHVLKWILESKIYFRSKINLLDVFL